MYKLLSIVTVLIVLGLASCDKINNPIIPKKSAAIPVTPPTNVDSTVASDDALTKILIEDYTAHNCTNCPTGSAQCELVQDGANGNQAVMLEVNATSLAQGYPKNSFPGYPDTAFSNDYRTTAGDNWNTTFIDGATNGMPGTMVDRLYYNGTAGAGSPDLYLYGIDVKTPFDSLRVTAQTANIHIVDSMYIPPVNAVSMTITTKIVSPQAGNKYYLVALLMEDSIYDWQDSLSNERQYYLHHWMMRDVINGGGTGWGDTLSATTAPQSRHYVYTSSNFRFNSAHITLPPVVPARLWNMAHMYVVAFVYQRKTGKNDYLVLQAQKLHL